MTSTRRGEGVRLRWTGWRGGGPAPCGRPHRKCGQGEGVKNVIFCGCHKWMAPKSIDVKNVFYVFLKIKIPFNAFYSWVNTFYINA